MQPKEFEQRYFIDRKGTHCYKWDGLKEKYGREDMYSMWVADMDFQVAEPIREALRRRVDHGVFGYTMTPDGYLDAFCQWEEKRHGVKIPRDWVCFAPGVVPAIYWCVSAFTRKGEGVMISTPVYYPFKDAVEDLGRKLVRNELRSADGYYTFDFEDMERKLQTEQVKIYILCSPHNPVGRVWKEEELEKVLELCQKYGVLVLADEIHQDFTYGQHVHHSTLCERFAGYRENLIMMTAASKTFNLAGLKNSFVVIPSQERRNAYLEQVKRLQVDTGCLFGYTAVEAAYREGEPWLEDLLGVIRENFLSARELFRQELPGSVVTDLEGTYLMWVDLRACLPPQAVKEVVQDKARVAVDFGEWFSDRCGGFIRLNLATSRQMVEDAVRSIIRQVKACQEGA